VPPAPSGSARAAAGSSRPEARAERAAGRFERQAAACAVLGSPLYAGLLRHAARDLRAGGVVARVLGEHLDDPGREALALRLLGGVHALVLTGRAAGLAAFYPSAGGTADPGPGAGRAWRALRRVLAERGDEVRPWLERPPQTNEIGRGAALAGALCHIVAEADLPVRLVEVGASAGLNLRADRFRITGPGAAFGDPASPVTIAGGWQGSPPPAGPVDVIARTGGDVAPVDPLSDDGRLRLAAYVWPDQVARLARLRGALVLASQVHADLRAEPASVTLARTALEPGTWTVLWHSVMRHYLDPAEASALDAGVAALAGAATPASRFAHVSLELAPGTPDAPVELVTWPGGRRRRLGTAPPHGIPVTWANPG